MFRIAGKGCLGGDKETEMKEYTEEIHAEGLIIILSEEKPCTLCPKRKMGFGISNVREQAIEHGWDDIKAVSISQSTCDMCHSFIEAEDIICPCYGPPDGIGKKEAIKRTWLALEKKGYLD